MESGTSSSSGNTKLKLSLSLDLRIIIVVLLVVIGVMLAAWRPWSDSGVTDRTIDVTGEAKLVELPDEYVFRPTYEFKNASKDAALAELTKKSDEMTTKLKELGVEDSKIKSNSDGYDYSYYYSSRNEATYRLELTITVNDKDKAQKVQDYLVTTTPQGSVSPSANFSDTKRKELENRARDEATKDARAKADQMAQNLEFKVTKLKSVKDRNGFGDLAPYYGLSRGAMTMDIATNEAAPSLSVQPGENDLHYSLTVTYYIK